MGGEHLGRDERIVQGRDRAVQRVGAGQSDRANAFFRQGAEHVLAAGLAEIGREELARADDEAKGRGFEGMVVLSRMFDATSVPIERERLLAIDRDRGTDWRWPKSSHYSARCQ